MTIREYKSIAANEKALLQNSVRLKPETTKTAKTS
jgi:hypothetical protein